MAAPRAAFRCMWRPASPLTFASTTHHVGRSACRAQTTGPWQSSTRSYRRINYQQFEYSKGLLQRWARSPYFFYHVAGIAAAGGGFYAFNLEEVPVSHRRRFNVISPELERASSDATYQSVMQEYGAAILPKSHPQHRMVQRVLDRLVPHSGLGAGSNDWEVNVIRDNTKNAFVIPGNKVFVFSGILDVCEGDDGLAAVLGHEIAHNVAHHTAEKISGQVWVYPLILLAILFGAPGEFASFGIRLAADFALTNPNSRKMESEADYIGLLMMSEACYNPEAAMALWARMEEEDGGNAPPQFLSTHPSNHNRLEKIREWLPQAENKLEHSGCGNMASYSEPARLVDL